MAIFLCEMHTTLQFYSTRTEMAAVPKFTVNLHRGCSSIVNQTLLLTWKNRLSGADAHEVPFSCEGPPLRISVR